MQISGTTIGKVKAPSTAVLPGSDSATATPPRAAPMTSEMSVAIRAMVSELAKAIRKALVVEQLVVVIEREAAPDGVALAVVEAEGDQRDERRVEEEEDAEQPEPHLPCAVIVEWGASFAMVRSRVRRRSCRG